MKEKEHGIRLTRQSESTGIRERFLALVFLLFYFYAGMYGCVYGFLGVFEIPCDREALNGAILVMGIFFAVVCMAGKYTKFLVVLTIAVYGWLLYRNFDMLLAGGNAAAEVIRRVVEAYQHGGEVQVHDLDMYGKEALAVLLAVIFLWSAILFSSLVLRGGRLVAAIGVAVILSAVLAVGQAPDFTSTCLVIFCLSGTFSTDGLGQMKGEKAGTFLTAVLTILFLTVGAGLLAPYIKPLFANEAKVKERIQSSDLIKKLDNRLYGWNTTWALAGVGNGELDIADYVSSTNRKVAQVTTDRKPEETIYLRCYTGANYTRERWLPLDESISSQADALYFRKFQACAEQNGVTEPFLMEIQPEDGAEGYEYKPYGSMPEDRGSGYLSYQYYPGSLIKSWDLSSQDVGSSLDNYPSFAYSKYTSWKGDFLPRLEEACAAYYPEDLEDLCRHIKDFLKQHASYNIAVGKFPEDVDFAEYFLFEKHEGYCVHFATAATLLFRMYGIPARYVTGYVVPAREFRREGEKYSAWVKDSRAHAWTEIFVNDRGWVPVEVTPGYTQMDTDIQMTERQTEQENRKETSAPERSRDQKERENEKEKIPAWAIGVLLAVAAGILGLSGRRRWILRRREEQGAREVFYDVCSVLRFAGFSENEDCQEEIFAERALARFPWLEREEFQRLIDLAVRANFSKGSVTEAENLFARKMYRKISREVYRELGIWKKAVFRWWYVYQ